MDALHGMYDRSQRMVQVEDKVSLCMKWFSIYQCVERAIRSLVDIDIKDW